MPHERGAHLLRRSQPANIITGPAARRRRPGNGRTSVGDGLAARTPARTARWAGLVAPVVAALAVLGFVGAVAASWSQTAAAAQAGEAVRSLDVTLDLAPSGDLQVREVIDYDFGSNAKRGIFRFVPFQVRYDDRYDRRYELDRFTVQSAPLGGRVLSGGDVSQTAEMSLSEQNNNKVVRIGNPSVYITGTWHYTIEYRVRHAVETVEVPQGGQAQELAWNAVGNQWEVPVGVAKVTVHTPVAEPLALACYTGALGSTERCELAGANGTFTTSVDNLAPGESVTVYVDLPAGSVGDASVKLVERWSLRRAFSATPVTLALSGLATGAITAGMASALGRQGRDRRLALNAYLPSEAEPETEGLVGFFEKPDGPVQFRPPEGMTPGLCGVLLDERADTLDVTASIVDLAVRGHLRIEELPGGKDFRLHRLATPPNDAPLLGYESALIDDLFSERADAVDLSDLRTTFASDLADIKQQLYKETEARKWFTRRPDIVRAAWRALGIGGFVVGAALTALLAWKTTFGLVGLPFVIGGIVVAALAGHMPARSGVGRRLLEDCVGFQRFLAVADADQLRFQERQNQFVAGLPYAMVFGLTKHWAETLQVLQEQGVNLQPNWYVGADPGAPFRFILLSRGLSSFSRVAGTSLSAPAPSSGGGMGGGGFSGGFSGGGGGGGGGGSW